MLKTRVLTAVLLLVVLLPGLFFLSQEQWALLAALVAGIAAWEWGGFMGLGRGGRIFNGLFVAALCAALSFMFPEAISAASVPAGQPASPLAFGLHGLAAAFWVLIVPLWLRSKWRLPPGIGGGAVGLLVLIPTWLALVQLRLLGPAVLLAILAVVWMADIAAYFAGKAFGRHKLAPAISPGKTWEGAFGAAAGVLLYGLAMYWLFEVEGISLGLWLPGLLGVTAVSILGDLFESLLKRQAGIKDSSQILPGHGGVLDRIDSLTSTLPVVTLLWLLLPFVRP